MPEVDPVFPRAWLEFADPADEGPGVPLRPHLADLAVDLHLRPGLPGHLPTSPDAGCCALGAHFSDAEDEERVAGWVERLDDDLWEKRHLAVTSKGKLSRKRWTEVEDGERKTRTVAAPDGSACIFHNSRDFAGGYGCALHALALREGVHFVETKPDVCWQLPIRRTFRDVERPDGTSYQEISIGEYERSGWGPGGHDLDWYCSGNTEAHVGAEPVYLSNATELIALMGQAAYDVLAAGCERHLQLAFQAGAAPGDRPGS